MVWGFDIMDVAAVKRRFDVGQLAVDLIWRRFKEVYQWL